VDTVFSLWQSMGGVVRRRLAGFCHRANGRVNSLGLGTSRGVSRFFVDGALAGTFGTAPNTPNGFLMIGGNAISGIENFDGLIDEVRFLQLIPEPSGIVLAGMALMGFVAMRRRKR
jgi:hypothetical protein